MNCLTELSDVFIIEIPDGTGEKGVTAVKRDEGRGGRAAAKGTVRQEILRLSLVIMILTVTLSMLGTLLYTLYRFRKSLDGNLLNSSRVVAQSPTVVNALAGGEPNQKLLNYLDESTRRVNNVDFIIAVDIHGKQIYHPNHKYVGKTYQGHDQTRALNGVQSYATDDTGIKGAERCAYAAVETKGGKLVGFVVVGIYIRSYFHDVLMILLWYLLIALAQGVFGALLSAKLSNKIEQSLRGYEPDVLASLYQQREEILEALEEGVIAVDMGGRILFINRAAAHLLNIDQRNSFGRQLHDIFPSFTLERVAQTGKAEYNISVKSNRNAYILSDRMPLKENNQIIGAVAIFRDRTEMTRLAEDLTGVRHMVEAMRGYTHEFMNKLHVILGLLELGDYQRAEDYILSITNTQRQAVGLIMNRIEEPSVAALLVGKTSRCAELGIRLTLDPDSYLGREERFLPPDSYITILGNLIDNATDALGRGAGRQKEISVTVREEETSLLLCVEDSGPGIPKELAEQIYKKGFSTKGGNRGTGLALVKEIVDLYNGEIRVESNPGTGTTFFLVFGKMLPQALPDADYGGRN